MQPAQRTLLILGVLLLSALVSFWLTGTRLLAPVPPAAENVDTQLALQPVTFSRSDGGRLEAWWSEPAAARAVVVLAHPLRSDRSSMLSRAEFLVASDNAVLLFDFQAHGASDGRHVTYGAREAHDLSAAVDYARQRRPQLKIVVLGVSLGAASAVLAAPALAVDGMVLESLYPTVDAAVESRLRLRYGAAAPYLTSLFLWQIETRTGIARDAMRPITNIGRLSAPVLLIAGSEDSRTPARETLWLYGALDVDKSVWLVGGASRQDLYSYRPQEYRQRVLGFVDGLLETGGAP